MLLNLLGEKENISSQMIMESRNLPEFNLFISLPEVGEISAALFIGKIGDLLRFPNHKKVNAFTGVDI